VHLLNVVLLWRVFFVTFVTVGIHVFIFTIMESEVRRTRQISWNAV